MGQRIPRRISLWIRADDANVKASILPASRAGVSLNIVLLLFITCVPRKSAQAVPFLADVSTLISATRSSR